MLVKTSKFKTNYVTIKFVEKLDYKNAIKRELLAYLLPMGTKNYNSMRKLNIRLEELYNSKLGVASDSLGNAHVLSFSLSFINQDYVEDIGAEALEMLHELIYEQAFDNEQFLEIAKEKMKLTVKEIYNDKSRYAMAKLAEKFDQDSQFMLSGLWKTEDIEKITLSDLKEYYEKVLTENQCFQYVIGEDLNLAEEEVIANIDNIVVPTKPGKKTFVEKSNVHQAKIAAVCTFDLKYREMIIMQLVNKMLGGGIFSRFFTEIREKEGLAYSIGSLYDRKINSLLIYAGVPNGEVQKTLDLMQRELSYIQKGQYADELLLKAQDSLKYGIDSIFDSGASAIANVSFAYELENRFFSREEYFKVIDGISREEVTEVAKCLAIDLVYVISGDEDEKVVL